MTKCNQYLLCVKHGKYVYAVAGIDIGAQSCIRRAEIEFEKNGFDIWKMQTKWGEVVTKQKNFNGYLDSFRTINAPEQLL